LTVVAWGPSFPGSISKTTSTPSSSFRENEPVKRVPVKVHFPASFFQDEAVSFPRIHLANHSAQRRNRRGSYCGARPLFAKFPEFDGKRIEPGADGFFKSLSRLSRRDSPATGKGHDDDRLRDVLLLLVVLILQEGDTPVGKIVLDFMKVCHALLNLRFPSRRHGDVTTLDL